MEKRVACVGAGYWGKNLVRNFHELGALQAICEPDHERRRELSALYPDVTICDDVDTVLADPRINGIAIATPAESHAGLVRRGLLAGKDVFVEKPLCLTADEGRELVALARERGRVLMVGHLLWYHPAILKLKELVDSGALGRLQYIYSNRLNLGRIRREENILWSFAPHDISVILGLLDEMPDRIIAQAANFLHPKISDVTVSVLSFPSGVHAHIFVSWLHPFKEQKLVVIGDHAMAVFNDLEPVNKLLLYPHTIAWKNHAPVPSRAEGEPVPFDMDEPLRAECAHFLERMADRTAPRTDGREALRVLTVLQSCQHQLDGVDGSATKQPPDAALRAVAVREESGAARFTVHESSYVDEHVAIGDGTTIWHFSHVLKNSRIGRDCRIGQNVVIGPNVVIGDGVKIQNNVSVYEGVELGDHVFCGPSVVFTNVYNPRSEIRRMDELRRTVVKQGASLGANCTIVCGITIGEYAFVGAGAVVHRDVPRYGLVVGNPGRLVGWMCKCGNRIRFKGEAGTCDSCGQLYQRAGEQIQPLEMQPLLVRSI